MCASLFLGCQGQEVLADISVCTADIRQIGVPENAKVTGFGEASHGEHEYQQMKAEIFQILVGQTLLKTFYTQTLIPADTYDAMIVFGEVTPTKLLSD